MAIISYNAIWINVGVTKDVARLDECLKEAIPGLLSLAKGDDFLTESLTVEDWVLQVHDLKTFAHSTHRSKLIRVEKYFATYRKLTYLPPNFISWSSPTVIRKKIIADFKKDTMLMWTRLVSKNPMWIKYLQHRCQHMSWVNACQALSVMIRHE